MLQKNRNTNWYTIFLHTRFDRHQIFFFFSFTQLQLIILICFLVEFLFYFSERIILFKFIFGLYNISHTKTEIKIIIVENASEATRKKTAYVSWMERWANKEVP